MNIQKRGNSYYLKASVWDADKKKTVSTSAYLGKNQDIALEKLGELVPPYEFMAMKDLLLAVSVKPVDALKEIRKHLAQVDKLIQTVDDEELQGAIADLLLMMESRG